MGSCGALFSCQRFCQHGPGHAPDNFHTSAGGFGNLGVRRGYGFSAIDNWRPGLSSLCHCQRLRESREFARAHCGHGCSWLSYSRLSPQILEAGIMFDNLDPVLNSQVRLAVVSILMKVKQTDFKFDRNYCILIFKNAGRHKLRSGLTMLGLAVALLAFGSSRTTKIPETFLSNFPWTRAIWKCIRSSLYRRNKKKHLVKNATPAL